MAQAVEGSVVAMRALFEVKVFQYPVEAPTHNIQNQAPKTLNPLLKGTQYGANYALSKRTVAYLHANNSTSTKATVATKVNGYGLGIHHSF